MTDVLDQTDIDALMSAVSAGEVEEATQKGQIFSRHRSDLENVEIKDYDFKRPERISKDQMRALHTLHEAFARNFSASLSGFLRTIVEVRVANADQLTYAEFISSLPNPTSFNLIDAPVLDGQLCLELSPLIIYPIIDRLLGGSSEEVFIPKRPLTLIETRLIQKILKRGMTALSEAWESVKKIDFTLAEMESNPQIVQIVPPNEVVVVIGFELKLGNRAGTMSLCIPFTVIEPLMGDISARSWFQAGRGDSDDHWGRLIADRIADASVEVTARLAETTITVADLRNLEAGDLIMTDKLATSPVTIYVEAVPKFLGSIGQHRGYRAVRIQRSIKPGDRI
ncbi:MAG: flagellar motor switch protein FliM [Planctomycetota bacterium]|nr:flagellar motor switch protein FliM [Planctomycetota bacterium]